MRHMVVHKRQGFYTGWPLPSILPDGRLAVVVESSPWAEHYALGRRITLVSEDEGETWTESDDPSIPSNWPASSTREGHDRFEGILPNGRYLVAGAVGWEVWPAGDREKAQAMGLHVAEHPDPESGFIVVGGHRVFVQWSDDRGKTWGRREWVVPGGRPLSFLSTPGPPLRRNHPRACVRCRPAPRGRIRRRVRHPRQPRGRVRPDRDSRHGRPRQRMRPAGNLARNRARAHPEPSRLGVSAGELVGGRRPNLVPSPAHPDLGISAASLEVEGRQGPVRLRVSPRPHGHTRCGERGREAGPGT